MTDPVDTDALRKIAAECNENNYNLDNGWLLGSAGDALDTAADEVDRLRAVVEDAPHDRYCGLERAQQGTNYCTCWKAGVL